MASWSNPGSDAFWQEYERFLAAGLRKDFAWSMATLVWWGLGYGLPSPRITSGRRSKAKQEELRERWERGEPGIFRPARHSKHLTGRAVDLGLDSPHWAYSHWAHRVGVRWAGPRDPVHYEEL